MDNINKSSLNSTIETGKKNETVAKEEKKSSFLKDIFLGSIADVAKSTVEDYVIPTCKKFVIDIVNNGLNILFYNNRGTIKASGFTSNISYNKISTNNNSAPWNSNQHKSSDIFDWEQYKFTYEQARKILDDLYGVLNAYGKVRVADLYEFMHVAKPFTANDYGWRNLSNATPVRDIDGRYWLQLPKAVPLN